MGEIMILILKTNYMLLKPLKADSRGNPDSGIWEFLLVESGILVFGIRNLPRGIQNPRLSWIPLHLGQADWSQVNISGLPGYLNPVKRCRIFTYYPWVIGDMLTWSLRSELFQPLTRMVISSNYKWASQGPVSTALMQNQLTQVTVNMFITS